MAILKILMRIFSIVLTIVAVVGALLIIMYITPAVWKNRVTYPRLDKERAALSEKYREPEKLIPLQTHKGVMHSHTYWSHDSRGVLPEILDAAKKAELEFIFFSDHAHGKSDTFPRGYHGVYDGIIMEAGTESSNGLMVQPFDSVVLDWNEPFDSLIRNVTKNGGLVTYVHTEKEHPWNNPDYHAMEIYNIHTDLLDEDGILPFVINALVNGEKYRRWGFRELYDDQTAILENWDTLNLQRRIVGIGAVDAHNNNNFRARYTDDDQVEWIGPNADRITIKDKGLLEKLLLDEEPDKYGWSFKWELDPYYHSFNFVNNHVFCDTFTNVNIKEHIIDGHVFVAFESLAKADGFQFAATDRHDSLTAVLGDSVDISLASKLKAVSPFPVFFRLYKNGKQIDESEESYQYEFDIDNNPGNYRLVADIRLGEDRVPWVFTNAVYVYSSEQDKEK